MKLLLVLFIVLALCVFEISAKSHRHRYGESPEEEEKTESHHRRSHRKYDDAVSDETDKAKSKEKDDEKDSDSSSSSHRRRHHSKTHVGPDTDSSRTGSDYEETEQDSERESGKESKRHHHHRSSRVQHTELNKKTVVPTDVDQKFSKGWAPTEIFWSADDASNGYNGNVRSPYESASSGSDYPAKV